MRALAVGRCLGLGVALASAALAIDCSLESAHRYNEFDEWLVARPMSAPIDFSRVGEVTVPFHQTCSISHGESIRLQVDELPASEAEAKQLVRGLAGKISIRDDNGREIESAAFKGSTIVYVADPRGIVLASLVPFEIGAYEATIRIDSGAPELASRKHTVFAQLDLCGLEQFPAVVCAAIAIGAGLVASVASIFVAPGLISNGLYRANRMGESIEPAADCW